MPSLPDTAPASLSPSEAATLWPASTLAGADATVSGAAFDVCRGALALRTLLAVNGAVLLAVLVGAHNAEQALAALGPAVTAALLGTVAWLAIVCALREPSGAIGAATARRSHWCRWVPCSRRCPACRCSGSSCSSRGRCACSRCR